MTNLLAPRDRFEEIVENRVFGLPQDFDVDDVHNILLDNSLSEILETKDNVVKEFISVLSVPENFGLTCKLLFNLDTHPFQLCILKELWLRKFPMFIATRGAGKSFLLGLYALLVATFKQGSKIVITGSGFRQSRIVFEYMATIWKNAPVFQSMVGSGTRQGPKRSPESFHFFIGESEVIAIPIGCLVGDTLITTSHGIYELSQLSEKYKFCDIFSVGQFREIGKFFDNGKKPVKTIRTQLGYQYTGTDNHMMRVMENDQIVWKRTDEIKVGDNILIDCCPTSFKHAPKINRNMAYGLGIILGCGFNSKKNYLCFKHKNQELISIMSDIFGMLFTHKRQYHYIINAKNKKRFYKLFYLNEENKNNFVIPSSILQSDKESMKECLRGIFDSRSVLQIHINGDNAQNRISLFNLNNKIVRQIQYILLHFGIVSQVENDNLHILDYNVFLFHKEIGFRLRHKNDILNKCLQYINYKDNRPIPISKEYLRCISRKYNFVGKFEPQKIADDITRETLIDFIRECEISNVNETIIEFLKIVSSPNIYYDVVESVEDSGIQHTYDINVPSNSEYRANGFFSHNSGDKIRGLRANVILADEFAKIPREIFEVVIKGFAVTSADPIERIKNVNRIEVLKSLGMYAEADELLEDMGFGNQIVISGTTDYAFNHFYEYWQRWKAIVDSRGDMNKLYEIFQGEIPRGFDWRQYSVFRIPWNLLPRGFLDETQIAQARATVNVSLYRMEYSCVWLSDSDGFFKRSAIEKCVTRQPIALPSGNVQFSATLQGDINKRYVFGIDPASERDNFAIVIIELNEDHRRVVYCWTCNRKKMKKKDNRSFYIHCARKIRDLMLRFPTEHIGIDTQGGGVVISETLHDPNEIETGEHLIWPYTVSSDDDPFWWEKPNKPTDANAGQHILHMINFANNDFVVEANHGLKKDIETQTLLFPYFDAVALSTAVSTDYIMKPIDDTLEGCMEEIEELKDELTSIQHKRTSTGKDKWDTPSIYQGAGSETGRARKDRYSALLIANMIGRTMSSKQPKQLYRFVGGYVGGDDKERKCNKNDKMYIGPSNIVDNLNNSFYKTIRR